MALFSRRTSTPVEVVTAAARKVELTGDAELRAAEARRAGWRDRVWEYLDQLGEAHEAARYYSDAMSRLTLFVGVRPDAQADPVPLKPEGDAELGYTAMDAAVCKEALERLHSPLGGTTELMRVLGLQLFAVGDCYLCGREDDTGVERWDIYSTDELRVNPERQGKWVLVDPDGAATQGAGTVLPDDATVARIWRPHPRYSTWSDSPMRSTLGILDELLIHTKAMRAVALSRVAGPGVLFLPNSMRKRRANDERAPDTDGQAATVDPVVRDVVEATSAAINDPASAAGQVPVIMWVDDEVYEKISSDKLIQWDRSIDETMARQREELRERFAVAIDLPAEVLTGKAGLNDWGAWNVDRQTFTNHLAPGAQLATSGLTTAYLQPYLVAAGVAAPERFVVWYDPSRLTQTADPVANARQAHDRYLISDAVGRREMGYSDDDAPTPEEIAQRLERQRAGKAQAPGAGPAAAPPKDDAPKGPDAPPEQNDEQGPGTTPRAVAAAAAPVDPALAGLTEELATIDAGLLANVHQVADTAMRRALERAGNRLASLAAKAQDQRGGMTRRQVQELAARNPLSVAPTLGPTLVQRLAGDTDLFDGAWAPVAAAFAARTTRAAKEVLRLARAAGELTAAQVRAIEEQLDAERGRGWEVLLAALAAVAVERLFHPDVVAGRGEWDGSLVPPGTVRESLVRAGGGVGADRAAGYLTARLFDELWREAGIAFDGWVWRYGDPSARTQPFEPHYNVDSLRAGGGTPRLYTGPDDPALQVGTWPFALWPDDHKGCLCTIARASARRASPRATVEAA